MRPVHSGEILREDYLTPLNMSASVLAGALHVPAPCIKDTVRERPGITANSALCGIVLVTFNLPSNDNLAIDLNGKPQSVAFFQ